MKLKFDAAIPRYADGDPIGIGIKAVNIKCECGHSTHVLEILVGPLWLQISATHEH